MRHCTSGSDRYRSLRSLYNALGDGFANDTRLVGIVKLSASEIKRLAQEPSGTVIEISYGHE